MAALREGKSSLVVAPTHGECRAVAAAVRKLMKEQRLLSQEDKTLTTLRNLNLTESERRDPIHYECGQVVEFNKMCKGGFKSGQQWEVSRCENGEVVVERAGEEKRLPLENAKKFNLYGPEQIAVAVGDQIRVTKNFQCNGQKFRNNELLTVSGIRERAITVEKGEIVSRGALHLDQGIAVTSHASQGKTVDQVIVSVPVEAFSQTNEAQFYVSMSRARKAMHLVTDSKAALREAVCRPSKRLSPWELIREANQERALQASMEMQRAAAVGKNSEKEIGYER